MNASKHTSNEPTVIVGGGFVGLFTALHLRNSSYPQPVVLIDPHQRFVFKPLLFESLTDEMQANQVLPRYADLLQGSEVSFVEGTVTSIDLQQRQVHLDSGLHYDYGYLVLGVGGVQGYFGTEGAEDNAFPFRTQEDAVTLQKQLRDCLQRASQERDAAKRRTLLTFAVIGAGPSGVEMAATLADLLPFWYQPLGGNLQEIRVVLVNRSQDILKGDINAHLQHTALTALKERTIPVELLLGAEVSAVRPDQLEYRLKGQDKLQILLTNTIIWTAGTATHPLLSSLTIPEKHRDRHGRPLVESTLQLPDFPEVFAAGDCATMQPSPLPSLAQVAYQQGRAIAQNLSALQEGKAPSPAQVKLRGTLMKLGIRNGVANLFDKYEIKGEVGDLIRNATYLEMLPTPVHDLKATAEWITDEIFHRYHKPEAISAASQDAQRSNWILKGVIIAIVLGLGGVLLWKVLAPPQPQSPPTQEQIDR